MTDSADHVDIFIGRVLALHGRVRPGDLHILPQGERAAALQAYHEKHALAGELYRVGDELVEGTPPAEVEPEASAPSAAAESPQVDAELAPPLVAEATPGVLSDIDALLGDDDAVARVAAAQPAAEPSNPAADEPTAVLAPTAAAAPAAGPPGVASDIDMLLGGYEGVEDVAAATQSARVDARPAESRRGPGGRGAPARPGKIGEVSGGSRLWMLWWLPTILLPLVGGLLAWRALRFKRERAATAMLALGLTTGVVCSVLFARYAFQIAGFVTGASQNTVITQPPTPMGSP